MKMDGNNMNEIPARSGKDSLGRFTKNNSYSNGRPTASRDKIAQKTIDIFSKLLHETDEEEKVNEIKENSACASARRLMRTKPAEFWKIMMKFLPTQIQTITPIDNIDSIPKDELDSALDAIKAKIKELENM